ncbi:MAG: aminoglycoside phosphotransferase family protein [Chloroflexota bacterium]|nr:aminoglycoside phosphotransferase family protein [Chloroflexota bacterium]
MSEASAARVEPVYTFHLIIPHPTEPRVLLRRTDGGLRLPSFEPEVKYTARVGQNNAWVREHLGLECITLYMAHVDNRLKEERRADATYVLQNRQPDWTPPADFQWVGRTEIANLDLSVAGQRAVIESWLEEREGRVEPPQRGTWNEPGWYEQATDWMRSQLEAHGIQITGLPEQIKHWSITSALMLPTDQGDYYFKAVPPVFAQEPGITAALSARYPQYVPAPLATRMHPAESWMLMPDFKGVVLEHISVEQLSEGLRILARMQIDSVSRVEELRAAGCPDRRLERLAEEIKTLLYDPVVLEGLLPEEIERAHRLGPRFEEMCERLASYAVPQTLLHGDFHGGNMLERDGNILIFDWTDGSIAHPFLDLITATANPYMAFGEAEKTAVRDAYLSAWTRYESPERLLEAAQLAWPLGGLHQAVSHRGIMATPSDATNWELAGAAGYFLKQAMKAVEQQDTPH